MALEYKGYIGIAEWDDEAKLFHGNIYPNSDAGANIHDVITFQCKLETELFAAFCDSVDDYIDFCKKD